MSEENISFYDLLDLSIGTPQDGAVNFSALHALLRAVLTQLDIRERRTRWRGASPGGAPLGLDPQAEEGECWVRGDPEEQEVQPGAEVQVGSGSSASASSQRTLRSRIQTCEDDVSKVRSTFISPNQRFFLK